MRIWLLIAKKNHRSLYKTGMREKHRREAWERSIMGEKHGREAWERSMGEKHGREAWKCCPTSLHSCFGTP